MTIKELKSDPYKKYAAKVATVESGNNANAKNPNSSALGLFQFTKSTWESLNDKYKLGYTLEDRRDPKKAEKVFELFTKENEAIVKPIVGRELNDGERYLSHFLGGGGASKFLSVYKQNPNAPIQSALSESAIRANTPVFKNVKTVGDLYNWASNKMGETSVVTEDVTNYEPTYKLPNFVESRVDLQSLAEVKSPEKVEEARQKIVEQTNEDRFIKEYVQPQQRALYQPIPEQQKVVPTTDFLQEYAKIEQFVQNPIMQEGGQLFNPDLADNKDFQDWYKNNTIEGINNIPYSDKLDYDYLSFYMNGLNLNPSYSINNHFPDTFKRPSHETFSNESLYSTPENPGGYWEGEKFYPIKMQQGGTIEADKQWLENWYTNRKFQDPATQQLYNEDRPSYITLSQFIPNPIILDSINGNPNIHGQYKPKSGEILLKQGAQNSAYLHEATHKTQDFKSIMRPEHNKLVNENILPKEDLPEQYQKNYNYLKNSDEVHARIQVLRNKAGFKPAQVITPNILQDYLDNRYQGNDSNINDLIELFDEEGLINLLNGMASNNTTFLNYAQQGGVINDNRGQWEHPGKITRINSPSITMKGVNYPVLGIGDTGEKKLMMPNLDYYFSGSKNVLEIPLK